MLHVGWMGHGGNAYLIEDLFSEVLSKIDDIKLTIITEWEPSEQYKDVIEYVKWGFNTWIDTYKKFDVVLCPQNPIQPAKSHIKIITAMALGIPVICSDHPAYKEIIDNSCNGFIYKDDDELRRMIATVRNDKVRKLVADNGYNTVMNRFSQKTQREKFADFAISDLGLTGMGVWHPSLNWSRLVCLGAGEISPVKATVGVVYGSLPTPYQSYGDFVLEAVEDLVEHTKHYESLLDLKDDCDAYIFIEFNPNWYNIPKHIAERSVLYAWDTHGHYMHSFLLNVCRIFKEVYFPGKMEVARLKDAGFGNVHWCPESYSSYVHRHFDGLRTGLTFIGQQDNVIRTAGGLTRRDYLTKIYDHYGDDFLVARGYYGHDYARIMNSKKLNIDIPISNNIGTRMFESTAMGVPAIRE